MKTDYTGYIVATDDRMVTVFTSLEEAEDYVKHQKECLKSTEG